jgi:O-antigen ligase
LVIEPINRNDGHSLPGLVRSVVLPWGGAWLLVLLGFVLVLAGSLVSQFWSPKYVFGAIALSACFLAVVARWPYGAFLAVVVASAMPRLSMEIGGWNARPDHIAVLLLLVVFVIRWMTGERSSTRLTGADHCVAAYVLWNYVSSALISAESTMTLRWALLNNLVVLPYFLIRFLVTDDRIFGWILKVFIAVGIVESAYAIISFTSRYVFGTSFGVEVEQYAAGFGGVYGTQFEPNLLGSYSGSLAIVLLVLYFFGNRKSHWHVGGIAIALAALLVSLSRAALLSFGFVSTILLFFGLRGALIRTKKLLPLALSLGILLIPIVETGGRNLAERFANLSQAGIEDDHETMGRLVALSVAADDIVQHPIVGNGTASFQLLADAKQQPILGDRPWVGNSIVRILHDTGVVGLILFGVAVMAIGKQIRNRIKGGARGREVIIALLAGCLVYAIAFMSTEGTMLSFFWVHVGLLASACSLAGRDSEARIGAED